MDANTGSLTALVTAFIRAYHATHGNPKVFDDFVARDLFTKDEYALLSRNLAQCLKFFDQEAAAAGLGEAEALDVVMQQQMATLLCRARYAEECLEEAVASGTEQYVILGAGFETYAFRRSDRAGRLHIFEVDHPATQSFKKRRLTELGWSTPRYLHFVPFDFTKESLGSALRQSAYSKQQASFWSWLGVSYYLPREVVSRTLRTIARNAPPGCSLVFDYIDADAFVPGKADKRMLAVQELVRSAGEPMQTGFDPLTLAADLQAVGFALKEDLGPAALDARYFGGRTDGLRAYAHVRLARAVVV